PPPVPGRGSALPPPSTRRGSLVDQPPRERPSASSGWCTIPFFVRFARLVAGAGGGLVGGGHPALHELQQPAHTPNRTPRGLPPKQDAPPDPRGAPFVEAARHRLPGPVLAWQVPPRRP